MVTKVMPKRIIESLCLCLLCLGARGLAADEPRSELIFPLQGKHVHSSSIVELPNGDFLTCWFQGSGERRANDVDGIGLVVMYS